MIRSLPTWLAIYLVVSKYRIVIQPSVHRRLCGAAFYIALMMSIFTWQQHAFVHQLHVQLILTCLLGVLGWREVFKPQPSSPGIISVCERGSWLQLQPESSLSWQIDRRSLVSSWFVWLRLMPSFSPAKSKWKVVFRDQVSKRDYRRLCRIALRQKSQPEMDC